MEHLVRTSSKFTWRPVVETAIQIHFHGPQAIQPFLLGSSFWPLQPRRVRFTQRLGGEGLPGPHRVGDGAARETAGSLDTSGFGQWKRCNRVEGCLTQPQTTLTMPE